MTNMRKIDYSHYVLIMFHFPKNERHINLTHCRKKYIFRFLGESSYNILLINVLFWGLFLWLNVVRNYYCIKDLFCTKIGIFCFSLFLNLFVLTV